MNVARIPKVAVSAASFGMALGVVGIGNCWLLSSRRCGMPSWIDEAIVLGGVATWVILMILYAARWR